MIIIIIIITGIIAVQTECLSMRNDEVTVSLLDGSINYYMGYPIIFGHVVRQGNWFPSH